jgi:hypothetical protein
VTGSGRAPGLPTLIARLLVEPDLLDALHRHDLPMLQRGLTADPALLTAICRLDVAGLTHYLRIVQRKRLEVIEPIFPASLPAAREQYGVDRLAAGFWRWYRQPASVPVKDVHADVATAWTGYAEHLAGAGPLAWLGDLSRYEQMRWRAVFYSVAPPVDGPERPERPERNRQNGRAAAEPAMGTARPALIPGASVAVFACDVPVLLKSLLDGGPPAPTPRPTRLITWYGAGRISTLRLGAAAGAVLLGCDGTRTIDQIAAAVSADDPVDVARVATLVRDLVRAGALRMAGEVG